MRSSEKSIGLRQWAVRKKSNTVSRPQRSSTSAIVSTFPTDFDIFSPVKRSMPLCIQTFANSCPRAR